MTNTIQTAKALTFGTELEYTNISRERAAKAIIDDFRKGRIGKIALETEPIGNKKKPVETEANGNREKPVETEPLNTKNDR